MNEAAPAPPEEVPAMPRTTDAPGEADLAEVFADHIAAPGDTRRVPSCDACGEPWPCTALRLARELAEARPVVAAVEDWGRARREEAIAKQQSFAADHRGPAWFARCVAGETRVAAEDDLFAAWEEYDAALAARDGGGEG